MRAVYLNSSLSLFESVSGQTSVEATLKPDTGLTSLLNMEPRTITYWSLLVMTLCSIAAGKVMFGFCVR